MNCGHKRKPLVESKLGLAKKFEWRRICCKVWGVAGKCRGKRESAGGAVMDRIKMEGKVLGTLV
jgi:hypothetical protein